MSNHDENRHDQAVPAEISQAYRAMATETSPASLDEQILRAAARDVGKTTGTFWGNGWLRPATFVATLGLSIALLMEFSEYQVLEPPASISLEPVLAPKESVASQPTGGSSAADDVLQTTIDRDEEVQAVAESATAPLNREAADARAFKKAASAAAKQVGEVDASADAMLTEMPASGPKSGLAQQSTDSMPDALASEEAIEVQRCTEERRNNPEEWWRCIGELRAAGQEDAARIEMRDLQETFPEFLPAQ